jgi:Zn-dependent peptidase ImmA (M78 family)
MGLTDVPEVKIARRLFKKHGLSIPFDLESLVKEYAKLIYKHIPITGVDGVSLNLKAPGKVPTVIVNSNIPATRQLFTLAHELGHIVIPWHIGTIVDDLEKDSFKDYVYSILEREANNFAAELLMPRAWMEEKYIECDDNLADLQKAIVRTAGVSDAAAAIQMIHTLPPQITFAAVEQKTVLLSGKTAKSYAIVQEQGHAFSKSLYPDYETYTIHDGGFVKYHWWKFKEAMEIVDEDERPWREILNEMANDLDPAEGVADFKKSINGIVANANSNAKREDNYSLETLVAACVHRLRRPDLESFVNHKSFMNFVSARARAFFNK